MTEFNVGSKMIERGFIIIKSEKLYFCDIIRERMEIIAAGPPFLIHIDCYWMVLE